MNPLTLLPAKVRTAFYITFALFGGTIVGLTAYTQGTVAQEDVDWLKGAALAYAAVGSFFGLTAAANVTESVSQKDEDSPTHESAGEASELPTGTPTTTTRADLYAGKHSSDGPLKPQGYGDGI